MTAFFSSGIYLWNDWRNTFQHAERRAQDTACLLEEHVRGILRSTNFILAESAEDDHQQDYPFLETALAEKGSLWILDRFGQTIPRGSSPPALASDLSQNPAFLAHSKGAITVLGPLSVSPLTGTRTFTVSRRMGGEHNFTGVALANIEAAYFTDFHTGLDLGPHASLIIATSEGGILLRQPFLLNWNGGSLTNSPVLQAIKISSQGLLRAQSPLDGIDRIVSYRFLPDLGVIVICEIAIQDVETLWLRDALSLIAILMVLSMLVVCVAFLGLRSIEREAATIRTLEQRIADRTEEANHQAQEAKRANYGKTRFLAAASHDLRQPLQAAGMFIEVLTTQIKDPKQSSIVVKLHRCIDATSTLLNALLDISSLECGQVQADISVFPLMPLLASLAEQMEPMASARGLSLKIVSTSAWVTSDRVLLKRILRNLLTNALRYTECGGVLLGCRSQGPHVAIQVIDSGVGIPPESQDTIFEDFTRLNNASPAGDGHGTGLGLGLGIVRRMAELLGHRLTLRSAPGRGSTFSVQVERG